MFANSPATAMIPVKEVQRAVDWYRDVLGIEPKHQDDMGATFELSGVNAFLYQSEFAGTAEHTILSFATKDLLKDMAAMREKGASFIEYDLPGLQTQNGIASWGEVKNAWCKDSEGNILGFVEGME